MTMNKCHSDITNIYVLLSEKNDAENERNNLLPVESCELDAIGDSTHEPSTKQCENIDTEDERAGDPLISQSECTNKHVIIPVVPSLKAEVVEERTCPEKASLAITEHEPLITSDIHPKTSCIDDNDEENFVDIPHVRPENVIGDTIRSSRKAQAHDGAIVLYKRRWYILFMLSMCVTVQNAVWGTWGPIAESAKYVYGWDTKMVFIIINCGNIGVLLPALFTGHMISSKGLRVSMIVCSFLLAVGSGLRTLSRHRIIGTVLVGVGQFCNGLAGSITQVIPAALSEAWFPVDERATATAIGVISNSVGSIVAFMLGPNIVDEPSVDLNLDISISNISLPNSTLGNLTDQQEVNTISHQIWVLTMIEFGVGAMLFILTLVYFPAKPPSPPSRSANEGRVNFTQSLCKVIRKPLILLAAMSCAVPWAVFGNWMGLLNINLHDIGISQSQAGFFGFYASIAGVVGGIAIGRIADQFQRRLKLFVMVVFFFALLIIVWITCMRNGYFPRSIALFAVSIALLGVMMNAALPLCYEMTCECGYPIHEGIIGTFISLEINAAAVIFLLIKFIPNIGVNWMNWTFIGVLAISFIFLFFMREKYRRTDFDITLVVEIENKPS